MQDPDELPQLRATIKLGGPNAEKTTWFDVKFCPFTAPEEDPVFALAGDRHTVICRPTLQKDNPVEVIRWFEDEGEADDGPSLNSIVWTQDSKNGDPLVIVSGFIAKIKILNVRTGQLVRTLIGHGGGVNDLAISPVSSNILASGSEDHAIRIWKINQDDGKNACPVILAGEGHKEGILTICFHPTGRYMLTGGHDTIINLWTLPEAIHEHDGSDSVDKIIHPHFSSTEVHPDIIDCVSFHGDLILSHAARQRNILLWSIDGFDSHSPPPPYSAAPPPTSRAAATRSAWKDPHDSSMSAGYQRLMTFSVETDDPFYMRFSLLPPFPADPSRHPILAMGTGGNITPYRPNGGRIHFWDLTRLQQSTDVLPHEWDPINGTPVAKRVKGGKKATKAAVLRRAESESMVSRATSSTPDDASSVATGAAAGAGASFAGSVTGGPSANSEKGKEGTVRKSILSSPFYPIQAHKTIEPKGWAKTKPVRQVAWSQDGRWCVAVGDGGMIALFARWSEGKDGGE